MDKTVLDYWDVIKQIDNEFNRAGWSLDEVKDYVRLFYKVKSRMHLKDGELLELLEFSKSLPTPKPKIAIKAPKLKRYKVRF